MIDIQKKIELKKQEIQQLKEKLNTAEVYLKVLDDIADSVLYTITRPAPPVDKQMRFPKRQTAIEKAAQIIIDAGRPLHANEILVKLGKKKTLRNKVSIASSMAHYANSGKIFKRVEPNTFDVIGRKQ